MAPLIPIPVEKEYEKNPELRKEDIKSLQEWMDKQPHLPKIGELELILFLHSCMYQIEFTKTTIDHYYTVRTHCPEFFANRNSNSPPICQAIDVGIYAPLPTSTPEGYKVILCKLADINPSNYVFSEALKAFSMVVDIWLLEEGTAPGHVIVFDMEGISLGHLPKLGLMAIKKYLFYLQEALPFRLKNIHYLHTVPFMDKILAMMKPFMKKELADALNFHDGLDTLLPFVPLQCLPKDYGGEADSLTEFHDKMKMMIRDNQKYFMDDEILNRVDESRRPGKAKNVGELFGVEGSFKKLDID